MSKPEGKPFPDRPGKPFSLKLDFKPMKGMGGGFRTEWVSGSNSEIKAGIDSGAGLGNPLITFWIEKSGGKRHYYTANVQDVLTEAISKTERDL